MGKHYGAKKARRRRRRTSKLSRSAIPTVPAPALVHHTLPQMSVLPLVEGAVSSSWSTRSVRREDLARANTARGGKGLPSLSAFRDIAFGSYSKQRIGDSDSQLHVSAFGSLYARTPGATSNVGDRIRLEHPKGPELSSRPSLRFLVDRKEQNLKRNALLPTSAIPLLREQIGSASSEGTIKSSDRDKQLIESRDGRKMTHISRGGPSSISLRRGQLRAIYRIARGSTVARKFILSEDSDKMNDSSSPEEKMAAELRLVKHARRYNLALRRLFMQPMFDGHTLQQEAFRRRDVERRRRKQQALAASMEMND